MAEESNEIQLATYEIVYQIASDHPQSLLQYLDDFPNHIIKGVKLKLKQAKEPAASKTKDGKKKPTDGMGSVNREKVKDVLRQFLITMKKVMSIPGNFYFFIFDTSFSASIELISSIT